MECWWWQIGIIIIYADTIGNSFVTQKLKALCHDDCYYCQSQGSKKIKDKNMIFDPWEIYIFAEV